LLMKKCPNISFKGAAETLGWKYKNGKPAKSRAQRALDKLQKGKFAAMERDGWILSDKGKAEIARIQDNIDAVQTRAS
jgi:hypothetical protein